MLEKRERYRSGQADLSSQIKPTTLNVIGAAAQSAYFGVGTYFADKAAQEVEQAKGVGTPISKQDFDHIYRQYGDMKWTPGMTQEAAAKISLYKDEQREYDNVLSQASTGQRVASYVPSFAIAMLEPKNLGIELGVSAGVGLAGFAATKANPITAAYLPIKALARTHRILQGAKVSASTKFAYGAGLGVVSAAVAEPSNRSSAQTLQEDYDYTNTLMNIATSAMLGGTIEAAPTWVRSLRQKYKGKAFDVHAAKMDTAAAQMAEGQPIDLNYPEAAARIAMADATSTVSDKITVLHNYIAEKTGIDILPSEPDLLKSPDVFLKESSFGELAQKLNPIVQTNFAEFLQKLDPLVKTDVNWAEIAQNKTLPIDVQKELTKPSEYVVRDRKTGETIFKTSDKTLLNKVNAAKYETVPLVEHFANLNGRTFNLTNKDSLNQAGRIRKLHEGTAFSNAISADEVLKKIVAENAQIVKSVDALLETKDGFQKLQSSKQELESLDDIYAQEKQFRENHANIMRMIESGAIDSYTASNYLKELGELDPDAIDNGFSEFSNCLLGM